MKRKNQTALIAFDGVCMLCQSSVHFILKRDTKDYFRFIPLEQIDKHGEWARLLPEKPVDSIVLMEHNKIYTQSSAVLRIVLHLSGLYPLLFVFMVIPRPLRDMVYDFIAKNRYRWFGKHDLCMIPDPSIAHKFL